jgi:predicted acylesterase/phospholipase RssA
LNLGKSQLPIRLEIAQFSNWKWDVLLASACLPTMVQAVEIDGERYWDGGYSGNPTITPLIRECKSQDTILVQINPVGYHRLGRASGTVDRHHGGGSCPAQPPDHLLLAAAAHRHRASAWTAPTFPGTT